MIKATELLIDENRPHLYSRNQEAVCIRRQNRNTYFQKRRVRPDFDLIDIPNIVIDSQIKAYEVYEMKFTPADFDSLIQNAKTGDPQLCLQAAVGLRKILSQEHSLAIKLVQQGGIKQIVTLAQFQKYPQIILQATWCLANLASFQGVNWTLFQESGAFDVLLNIIKRSEQLNIMIYEHAVVALSNIASDCQELRDWMLEQNCIEYMVTTVMKHPTLPISTLQNTCWAFSNIIRAHQKPPYDKIECAIKYICCVLAEGCQNFTDQTIITDCIFVLAHNLNIENGNLEETSKIGFLPYIIQKCFNSSCKSQIIACLRVIGNFSTGDEKIMRNMIYYELILVLTHTLDHENQKIRTQTCWVLSNIAPNPQDISKNLSENVSLLQKLATLLDSDTLNVKKEICFIFANLSFSTQENTYYELIFAINFPENVSQLLACGEQKIIFSVLHCLAIVLSIFKRNAEQFSVFLRRFQRCQGFVRLQALQQAKDDKIYQLTVQIIQKYLQCEQVDDGTYGESSDQQSRYIANGETDGGENYLADLPQYIP